MNQGEFLAGLDFKVERHEIFLVDFYFFIGNGLGRTGQPHHSLIICNIMTFPWLLYLYLKEVPCKFGQVRSGLTV